MCHFMVRFQEEQLQLLIKRNFCQHPEVLGCFPTSRLKKSEPFQKKNAALNISDRGFRKKLR